MNEKADMVLLAGIYASSFHGPSQIWREDTVVCTVHTLRKSGIKSAPDAMLQVWARGAQVPLTGSSQTVGWQMQKSGV